MTRPLAFPTKTYFGSGFGSFNHDGNLDVLGSTGSLYEFLGNGDDTFQPPIMLFPSFGEFILADVNRDGWTDIIALTDQFGNAATYIPTVSTFLSQSDGSFLFSQTSTPYLDSLQAPDVDDGLQILANPFGAVPGDFNGDGNPDVAIFQYAQESKDQPYFANSLWQRRWNLHAKLCRLPDQQILCSPVCGRRKR